MKEKTIRRIPLFSTLPSHEIRFLVDQLEECTIQPGEVVLKEGVSSQFSFILLEGDVEIIKLLGTPDERLIAVREAGSLMGEMSLFSQGGAHTASVRARTPLKILKITQAQFEDLLIRQPELSLKLLSLLSRRLEESENMTISDLREKNRQLTLAYQELKAAQAEMLEKKKLEHELEIAAEIQRSILPQELPDIPGIDIGARMDAARMVGGDFYDLIDLDDHRLGIVVGDVCDKGMPAALFMALTYSSVRTEAVRHSDPGSALRAVNRHLLTINHSSMFVTLLFGILDWTDRSFTFARAGHPYPLILDSNHQPVFLPVRTGQPVGLFDDIVVDEQSVILPQGGTMLVFSDGLSESLEGSSIPLTLPQLCAALLAGQPGSAQDLCDRLWESLGAATSESVIQDDFTVVALKDRAANNRAAIL